jgi:hypothetical protein
MGATARTDRVLTGGAVLATAVPRTLADLSLIERVVAQGDRVPTRPSCGDPAPFAVAR